MEPYKVSLIAVPLWALQVIPAQWESSFKPPAHTNHLNISVLFSHIHTYTHILYSHAHTHARARVCACVCFNSMCGLTGGLNVTFRVFEDDTRVIHPRLHHFLHICTVEMQCHIPYLLLGPRCP